MPTWRGDISAVTYQNKIYVICGRANDYSIVGTNQICAPATDSWSLGTPIPTARYSLCVATIADIIYDFGCLTCAFVVIEQKDQVEQYNPLRTLTCQHLRLYQHPLRLLHPLTLPPTSTASPTQTTTSNSTPTTTPTSTLSPSPSPTVPELPLWTLLLLFIIVTVVIVRVIYKTSSKKNNQRAF
jgi:hypothetical protein